MRRIRSRAWMVFGLTVLACCLGATIAVASAENPPAGPPPGEHRPPALTIPVPMPPVVIAEALGGPPVQPGPWWIGIQCRSADPALKAQLGLAHDVGLLVEEVVPDSPAAKAGLQRFDVLVKAGDKELRAVQDLIDVINKAEGKEVKLQYVRRGQTAELTVTPEKRPPHAAPPAVRLPEWPSFEWPDWEELPGPGGPFRFRFFYPGRVLPPREGPLPPLPGNLAITITKKGDEPAKITVKRDGESWEVTENELDKLPEDVRKHVEAVLRGGPQPPAPDKPAERGRRDPRGWGFYWPTPPGWSPAEEHRLRERIEREMKELQRRIDELRERIEELRKRVPGRPGEDRPHEGPPPHGPSQPT